MSHSDYIKVSEAAKKWGISTRRVRILCAEGRIAGVMRKGNLYMISAGAVTCGSYFLNVPQPVSARLTAAAMRISLISSLRLPMHRI